MTDREIRNCRNRHDGRRGRNFVSSSSRRQDDITSRRYGRSSYEAFAQPALTWVLSLCIIYSPRFDRVFVFGTAMTLATSSTRFWNRPCPLAISNRARVFPALRGNRAFVTLLRNDFCETCQDTLLLPACLSPRPFSLSLWLVSSTSPSR